MTTSTAIRAQDFSPSTADTLRGKWTAGKLRHLIAALDGAPVAITIDSATGFALVGAKLVGLGHLYGHGWPTLTVEHNGQRTAYGTCELGDTIIPLEDTGRGAKWDALGSYRQERMAAIASVRAEHEAQGRTYGRWNAEPCGTSTLVTYEPQRADGGTRWSGTVPLPA